MRIALVVLLTLLLILFLLCPDFRRMTETLIVMLALPFALVAGLWLMWWPGFNLSVAVEFIALTCVGAETGVIMLIYFDHAWAVQKRKAIADGREVTRADLYAANMEGAAERVRPKMMIGIAIMAWLVPILRSHGTDSEVMQRIEVPTIGGMVPR